MERSLILIKPDAVQRGLIGEIVSRIEKRGLRIDAMKLMQVSQELAEQHYGEHKGKPFYNSLIEFITSSPVVAMVVAGPQAVSVLRAMMGKTDARAADPGTIRGDFGLSNGTNLVHGSDSLESARREIERFFTPAEICVYTRNNERWINTDVTW
ncbi:MAG: nucleoside-diphosphate kinase [Anaerolineales bacterium]|nr:MAG: nucleoside-diphosphate kinase [Anaerolineales bacterium]